MKVTKEIRNRKEKRNIKTAHLVTDIKTSLYEHNGKSKNQVKNCSFHSHHSLYPWTYKYNKKGINAMDMKCKVYTGKIKQNSSTSGKPRLIMITTITMYENW